MNVPIYRTSDNNSIVNTSFESSKKNEILSQLVLSNLKALTLTKQRLYDNCQTTFFVLIIYSYSFIE